MEQKKVGTVSFGQTKNELPIFTIGIFKKEVDALIENNKYINAILVSEKSDASKLSFMVSSVGDKIDLKDLNLYGKVSLNADKISELVENNGYYNVAAMLKTAKEGEVLTPEQKMQFNIFQTQENKPTVYIGQIIGTVQNSIGVGFVDKSEIYINSKVDKVKLLFTPENEYGNVVIGSKIIENGDKKFISYYPTTTADKLATGIIEIDKSKALQLPIDEKGNILFTVAQKKEESISKDKANMTVYQTQKEADKGQDKNYIGKGWDRELQKTQEQKKNSNLSM